MTIGIASERKLHHEWNFCPVSYYPYFYMFVLTFWWDFFFKFAFLHLFALLFVSLSVFADAFLSASLKRALLTIVFFLIIIFFSDLLKSHMLNKKSFTEKKSFDPIWSIKCNSLTKLIFCIKSDLFVIEQKSFMSMKSHLHLLIFYLISL